MPTTAATLELELAPVYLELASVYFVGSMSQPVIGVRNLLSAYVNSSQCTSTSFLAFTSQTTVDWLSRPGKLCSGVRTLYLVYVNSWPMYVGTPEHGLTLRSQVGGFQR